MLKKVGATVQNLGDQAPRVCAPLISSGVAIRVIKTS